MPIDFTYDSAGQNLANNPLPSQQKHGSFAPVYNEACIGIYRHVHITYLENNL